MKFWGGVFVRTQTTKINIHEKGLYTQWEGSFGLFTLGKMLSVFGDGGVGGGGERPGHGPARTGWFEPGFDPPDNGGLNPRMAHFWSL